MTTKTKQYCGSGEDDEHDTWPLCGIVEQDNKSSWGALPPARSRQRFAHFPLGLRGPNMINLREPGLQMMSDRNSCSLQMMSDNNNRVDPATRECATSVFFGARIEISKGNEPTLYKLSPTPIPIHEGKETSVKEEDLHFLSIA